jgi:hypothetical protein
MELQLYHTVLLLAGGINILIAFVLLHNNYWYHDYGVYHRSRRLVALTYVIFGIGFLLHEHFEWRTSWPAAATALSLTYFHCAGVFFGWSHTSLLNPLYLNKMVVRRDLTILFVSIIAYWIAPLTAPEGASIDMSLNSKAIEAPLGAVWGAFFLHAAFIAFTFYRTYYQVRRNILHMPADAEAPQWWTPELKRTVLSSHHSFIIGAHLIILFGIGGIVITALLPTAVWPFTLLLVAGICVFIYIFYSLTEYGNVIESGACATEDAATGNKSKRIINK